MSKHWNPVEDTQAVFSEPVEFGSQTFSVVTKIVPEHVSRWAERSTFLAITKTLMYFGGIIGLLIWLANTEAYWITLLLQLALGVFFAHGLELQHECLHHNLASSPTVNRALGFLFGIPMLVSYTHYKVQHLHHHKYVGTVHDHEIFDYKASQLRTPLGLVSRAWNWQRIPAFLITYIHILQGSYPAVFRRDGRKRRHLRHEYTMLVVLLLTAAIMAVKGFDFIVKGWFLPWLAVAEPIHFLIELPEHIGCATETRDPLRNTRSYHANPIWRYITNSNNYHIEHHLLPNVATRHLRSVHEAICADSQFVAGSYWEAIRGVIVATRAPLNSLQ